MQSSICFGELSDDDGDVTGRIKGRRRINSRISNISSIMVPMAVAGVLLAVGIELMIRALRQQYRGVTFSPLTFVGAVCFLGAIANYANRPIIT